MSTYRGPEDPDSSQDAWIPDFHFGDDWSIPTLRNERVVREKGQQSWEREAHHRNRYFRPIWKRVLCLGKVTAWEVMLEDASAIDRYVDKHNTLGPFVLYHQRMAQAILEESGIETPKRYPTREVLEAALGESDVPYEERVVAAYRRVRAESEGEENTQLG